jgi:acetyl esterase/lipase
MELFPPQSIDKETLEFIEGMRAILSAAPYIYDMEPEEIRKTEEAGLGLFNVDPHPRVIERKIPGRAGEIPIRICCPDEVKAVYLSFHGGGFMLGRAYFQDQALVKLAEHCKVATISVDYRLAPENPYPAGPDDCEAAAVWLVENIEKEFGTNRILIGGESAGACLALVTLLRMRDRHGYTGFLGANLVYGCFDASLTPSTRNFGEAKGHILTTKTMEWFFSNYAKGKDLKNPDVSPLYADLSHLPPALFTIGTLDPLLDDSLLLHSRWLAGGNKAELEIYPGGIHAFNAFPIGIATQANNRIAAFIRQILKLIRGHNT